MSDVSRKLKETLFEILNDPAAKRENSYYGGVLANTKDGFRVAYLRLTFEPVEESDQ